MHKTNYASGFLYLPATDQILLQQTQNESSTTLSMLSTESATNVAVEKAFSTLLKDLLKLKIQPNEVHEIYSYVKEEEKKNYIICYAVLEKPQEFKPHNDTQFLWVSRKQISKLPLSPQTKQNLIVGMRVIDAKLRKQLGQHTLE